MSNKQKKQNKKLLIFKKGQKRKIRFLFINTLIIERSTWPKNFLETLSMLFNIFCFQIKSYSRFFFQRNEMKKKKRERERKEQIKKLWKIFEQWSDLFYNIFVVVVVVAFRFYTLIFFPPLAAESQRIVNFQWVTYRERERSRKKITNFQETFSAKKSLVVNIYTYIYINIFFN